ncbi:uncharacterized protein LOC107791663 [Nicotiana tabacum]|uniref:Uncharacterized protein n=3 Tax=Nicotiana tabacum TaxID=4097 RepID=A0A1S3ZXR9_TOBAC|nr:PREDICTED: uncharacterized protein LOC107791663 [Nicotiana tabacum]
MDGRSWKTLSQCFGWKVKTHGFAIRGVTAEAVVASRISLKRAQEIILGSSSKRKTVDDQASEEKEDGGSLVTRPRARRCIISDDEAEASPRRSIPLTESVEVPVVIPDDVDDAPAAAHDSFEQLFDRVFGRESLGPVSDEAPLASFSPPVHVTLTLLIMATSVPPQAIFTTSTIPPSTIPPPPTHRAEVGSSSRSGSMRQVIVEVTAEGNLLRKSGQADVWLKPLIGLVERARLESHCPLTLMNDIVHASLKANLIGTEMMKRVTLSEQLVHDYQLETYNWNEQYESLQIDMKYLKESKSTLEQQVRALTSELAVEKAFSSQADKEKARLETFFSEQLSKASEDIRELKVSWMQKKPMLVNSCRI